MRLAVISDIHGNMEAFEQVLADIDRSSINAVVCLGDMIGYGPDSQAVVETIQKRTIPCVMGNHELAVKDPTYLYEFNLYARISHKITCGMLGENTLDYIRQLPDFLVLHGCRFVHGFPPDSATEYLFHIPQGRIRQTMSKMNEKICFVGHTHLLGMVELDETVLKLTEFKDAPLPITRNLRYIINAGSVGQPRDPDKRAKYLIWDATQHTVEARHIEYDRQATARKIRAAGLPQIHAYKLL